MHAVLTPAPLRGSLSAIASKSHAHRALICAALCAEPTELILQGSNDDIDATMACLSALGVTITRHEHGLHVCPPTALCDEMTLDCRESGSTLRFLLPVVSALGCRATFVGRGRLPERPLSQLCDCVRGSGGACDGDKLPLHLSGHFVGGTFSLPGDVSSQYLSGLLLAAGVCPNDCTVALTSPLQSRPYVELTIATMAQFGVQVQQCGDAFFVPGAQRYRTPGTVSIEGDWSCGAFWLAAGALGDGVTVHGLPHDSLQGDRAMLDLLRAFGAQVDIDVQGAVCVRGGALRGIDVDLGDIPDLLPPLAVVAAAAQGQTRFCNAARLRLKESDRLASVCAMLLALGGRARIDGDTLLVDGCGTLRGGTVDSVSDHRIAMAAAIASTLCTQSVTILDADCTNKSYPDFFLHHQTVGGTCDVLSLRSRD